MTIDVKAFRAELRARGDAAAARAKAAYGEGNTEAFEFNSGKQAAFLTAINLLAEAEDATAAEYDANLVDEEIGEEAARLGLIGARAVNVNAVERLEEFARNAGGAVDMASGQVYSDAGEGL